MRKNMYKNIYKTYVYNNPINDRLIKKVEIDQKRPFCLRI